MKLELKLTNEWLEATWYEEADEVKTQVHCESFSGHNEHIAMLRVKITEYGEDTTVEDEALIAECVANFKYPTEAELAEQAKAQAIAEARSYLNSTDWIKNKYVELVVMKKTMTEEEFNLKYEVELAKMDEARAIL